MRIQHKKIYPASTMVYHAKTKEDTSIGAHGEMTNEKNVAQGNKAFKYKGPRRSNAKNKKYEGTP